MICSACEKANPPDARFCSNCGARLGLVCAHCSRPNDPDSRFCNGCGKPLDELAPPTTKPGSSRSRSYTPAYLAARILTSRAALEGERKQVTVLFADLKGSMELLADRDPEDARALLDPVLERLMDAVHRFEGTVNQVMGDGIMALFGAPLAHEDHAVRASYAALRMQESVREYAAELRRTQGVLVQIRVGLNSGEVVVRSVGSDLRMDYTAVGQTTHLAARMEQLATPGTTLMTASTFALAEGYVAARALGPIAVKAVGTRRDLRADWRICSAHAASSRRARGLSAFVGRNDELEQLRRAGAGRRWTGPGAGGGRGGWWVSRACCMSFATPRGPPAGCSEAARSYGKSTSYLPLIDLLKNYFHIQDRDDARKIRERISGSWSRWISR
jgi:class 3 adenylate cyclase